MEFVLIATCFDRLWRTSVRLEASGGLTTRLLPASSISCIALVPWSLVLMACLPYHATRLPVSVSTRPGSATIPFPPLPLWTWPRAVRTSIHFTSTSFGHEVLYDGGNGYSNDCFTSRPSHCYSYLSSCSHSHTGMLYMYHALHCPPNYIQSTFGVAFHFPSLSSS